MRTNTYEFFRLLHGVELRELKKAVDDFGGEIHFGEDYIGEDGSGTERPLIAVNRSHGEGPEDVYINACSTKSGELEILAETKEWGDEFILRHEEIEFGHVSFITDLIPDKHDYGEASLIHVANISTITGELIEIDTNKQTWKYQVPDDDYVASGEYFTDIEDGRPFTVIGFSSDRSDELPRAVRDVLKRLGYALDL